VMMPLCRWFARRVKRRASSLATLQKPHFSGHR